MKPLPPTIEERKRAVAATIAAAVREGRHSLSWTAHCDQCGKPAPIYTFSGRRRLCPDCAGAGK